MTVKAGAGEQARVEGDEVDFRLQFHLELVAFPPASEALVLKPVNKRQTPIKFPSYLVTEFQIHPSLPIQICSFQLFNLIDKLRICYNRPRQLEILDENNSGHCT